MNNRFCLNTATIRNAPLETQIELARQAGFRQIGLWLRDVEAAMDRGESLAGIKAGLDSAELRVAEFCFVGGWQEADSIQLHDVMKQTHHISEVSRALGCDVVVVVPAARRGGLATAPARLRQMCSAAAQYDVRIALEFPGMAAEVNNLRSAFDLVAAAGCPNGGLVIDTFHFFLGGSNLADFARLSPRDIFLVHVSDAMNLPMEKLRLPHDHRTFPGAGVIDFAPIFEELNKLCYRGPVSLEIWNRELHQSDPAEMLAKSCESLRLIEGMMQYRRT